jgi:hypothetical protein
MISRSNQVVRKSFSSRTIFTSQLHKAAKFEKEVLATEKRL